MLDTILISFVIAALVSFVMTPFSIRIANKVGAVDIPSERKTHKKITPRLGGLAIITGFIVSIIYVIFIISVNDTEINIKESIFKIIGYLVGVIILSIVCFVDDIKNIKARYKLIAQIIAAIIVIYSGLKIDFINIPGLNTIELPGFISYIITICWIIGITNAINLIDGLDGLSSGISLISCISLIVIFMLSGSDLLAVVLITALAGAILGFLPYNVNPAKTFIGDIGSNFLGYSLAVFSIFGVAKTYTALVLIAPIIILGFPIMDVICAILRRIIKGKNIKYIMKPDRGHLHHKLVDSGIDSKKAVYLLYALSSILGIFSIILLESGIWIALSFALIVCSFIAIGFRDFIKENINQKKIKSKLKEEK